VRLVCEHGGHGQNGRQSRAQDAEGGICIVKNLNDGHVQSEKAEIILTSSLKQFRLDNIEVWLRPSKILVRAMMLQGCRKADRAEVVERDRFATPNSLKSHGERNLLSPFSNTCAITLKLCHAFEANTPFEKLPGTQINVPRLNLHKRPRTAGAPLPAISCLGAFRTPAAAQRG